MALLLSTSSPAVAAALDDHAVNGRFEFERLAQQFGRFYERHHVARLHAVVQVEVELGQPAFERGRDLGGLVQVGADAACGLERHAETAQLRRFGLERDVLQVFLGERDDVLVVSGFGLHPFGVSGLVLFAAPGEGDGEQQVERSVSSWEISFGFD